MRPLPRILFAALAISLALAADGRAQNPRRNVVFLIADDLGLDLGCYGNKVIQTPNIDALAANGTRFSNAFACVSSCSPSRATLYTGMQSHSCGQYGLAHATHNAYTFRQVQSLPRILKAAGYRSGIVAKVHVQPKEVYPWDEEIPGNGRNVPLMAEQARKFIQDSGDKPFLLVMGYTDPHRAAKGFGNAVKGVPDITYNPAKVELPYHLPDQPDCRADLADYYRSATRLDYGIGLLMKVLKELKHEDDTLVIFLSDNGIPFPGAKTTLYDAGLHLPLIIHAPGRKPGVCNGMASYTDIAPTILDWMGQKQPAAMQGRSLLPILEQENPAGWDEVFGSHQFHEITMYYPMRMIRTRNHKYILNLAHELPFPTAQDLYDGLTWQGILKRGDTMLGQRTMAQYLHRPKEELYDLRTDPSELKNLADDPKQAETLADLRKRLKTWQEKTQDPWLVKYVHE
ncbi:MAG TPA: sulfatase [Gemmataceae bacterium]|nr:sulfatase [Gemmataceae bacterium]